MSDYILGLDLGPNSIGWALVAASFEDGEPVEVGLLDTSKAGHPALGVRIFKEGLPNFGTSEGKSLAQERRSKRSLRRIIARRRARKNALLHVLREAGLAPHDPEALAKVIALNPYQVRADALDRPLAPEELGRALFHLAQRRGFKSNRKSTKAAAADERRTLKEMGALSTSIQSAGARTLGEYLHLESLRGSTPQPGHSIAPVHRGEVRLRGRFARQDLFTDKPRRARRDQYEYEFRAILEAQRRLTGCPILTADQEKRARFAIFHQHDFAISEDRRFKAPPRANLHRAPQLKPCPLEPNERRARRSDWIAQRFRILKEVNNLRIIERGRQERKLTESERNRCVELLGEQKEVKFDRMRKELRLHEDATFNLERGSREELDGNELDATLVNALGKDRWRALVEEERQSFRDLIEASEDEDTLKSELERRAVPSRGIEKLLKLGPEDRYLAYSRKALGNLVPHLEHGTSEYGAIALAYPKSGEAKVWKSLPSLVAPGVPADIAEVTNPIVRRALVEVRKVVNAIVQTHGMPRRIVVELARDMHEGPDSRAEHSELIRDRAAERIEAKDRVIELTGNSHPRRADIDKYLMWKEQGTRCLYTDKQIDQGALFNDQLAEPLEIDHILPRWASLDDSRPNKVLCLASANQAKGDRTPAEWLGTDSPAYAALLTRAEEHCKHSGLPWSMLSRLRQEHVEADDFTARQLNDTRYISRLVTKYLAVLFSVQERTGQKAILTSRGSLTAELRHQWGLNDVLDPLLDADGKPLPDYEERGGRRVKLRIDHRHHAIDALIVALSSRSRLKRYQEYWKRTPRTRPTSGSASGFAAPWVDFRNDVAREAANIQISHRVSRKIIGALHADTFCGRVRLPNGQESEGIYVTRKNLEGLTAKELDDETGRIGIVDRVVRGTILSRLRACGWVGGKSLPKDWWRDELRLPSGVPIRRVRVREVVKDGIPLGHRIAKNEGNHHMAFDPITMPGQPLKARVLRMMDVATAMRRGKERPLTPDRSIPESAFPIGRTLARNELVEMTVPGTDRRVLAVVQNVSGSRTSSTTIDLTLRDARDARPASTGNKTPLKRASSTRALLDWRAHKVQIDPLGRIFPAGD